MSVRVDDRLVDDGGRVRCHALGGVTYHPGRPGHVTSGIAGETAREVVRFAGTVLPEEPDAAVGSDTARFRSDLDRPSGRAVEVAGAGRRQVLWIAGDRVTEIETETATDAGGTRHQAWTLAVEVVDGRRWLPRLVAERVTERVTGASARERCRDVLDDWTVLGTVVVPARRRIEVQLPEQRLVEIELHHHRLIPRRR